MHMKKTDLINYNNFIHSIRDSGYKNLSSALAELVDNSIEAKSSKIKIQLIKVDNAEGAGYEVEVYDNGIGMSYEELCLALQFGGSTRYNSRIASGRFGMGLPNSSLSQCRRVEITTKKKGGELLHTYLDIDEFVKNNSSKLHDPES